jgi:hypothetical protein
MGAAAAAATALRLSEEKFVSALGVAGSMAAGIIEYLAEGAWTKRLHPGWAAQSGIRAADLARAGFIGPRTVFEGAHGFYHGFARTSEGDWSKLIDGFGSRWIAESLAFPSWFGGNWDALEIQNSPCDGPKCTGVRDPSAVGIRHTSNPMSNNSGYWLTTPPGTHGPCQWINASPAAHRCVESCGNIDPNDGWNTPSDCNANKNSIASMNGCESNTYSPVE